ncbi:phage tail tape measure protein, partial [Avibacterium paragallinarum]
AIQREINQTIAAYQRLKSSGMASSREIARAAVVAKQKIAQLNAEMGKVPTGQRIGNWGRNLASMTIGVGAGVAVAMPKIKNAADYDLELANIANTAYSGKSIEEKTKGKNKIHNAIKASLSYGGTKEDSLIAINKLIGEGNVSVDDALRLLPVIQKNATATNSSTSDISGLVNSLLNFNVKVEDIQKALDYANASGKAGGFELKDMAQYAPQFLSQAKNSGLGGLEDLKQVLKGAQQTYKVSGGSAQTATNLVNFFSKLRSPDTVNRFKKLDIYDPKTKKTHGVDLEASMINEMKAGKSPIEAFMQIVDMVLAQDKTYQQLLKKLENAKEGEQQVVAEKIANYVETTKIGELMPDIQASAAMFAMRRDKNTANNVDEQYQIAEKGNFNQSDFDFIKQQNAFKFQKIKNDAEMASIENWNNANNPLGKAADWLGEKMEEFPAFTNAIVGATDALKIFGAGLAGFSLLDILSRSRGGRGGFGIGDALDIGTSVGGKGGKGGFRSLRGFKGLGPLLALEALHIAGDNYTTQAAINEEKTEAKTAQQKAAEQQFYQTAYPSSQSKYQWAPTVTQSSPSVWSRANGAYAIAEQKQKQEIAQIRLARGSLTQEQYDARMSQSATRIADLSVPISANAANDDGLTRLEPVLNSLANYQADFDRFGQTLSDGLKQAIESQNFVIQNQIKVDLDGRIVAEQTSEYHYQDLKRWG